MNAAMSTPVAGYTPRSLPGRGRPSSGEIQRGRYAPYLSRSEGFRTTQSAWDASNFLLGLGV